MEAVRDVVMGVLGSVFNFAEMGGRECEGVLIEVADEEVGRIGEVFVL